MSLAEAMRRAHLPKMHRSVHLDVAKSAVSMLLVAVIANGCASRTVAKKEPTPINAPDSIIVATTETTVDTSIPPGEVDGVVVHGYHGTPIANVAIWAYSLTTKKRWQSQTDSAGRFRIADLPTERILFVFRMIGYVSLHDTIDAHTGVAARIALVDNTITLCACDVPPDVPAVTVLVRDVRTSRAPRVPVTLRLRDGSFAADTTALAPTADADSVLELSLDPCREGNYSIEVSAPGYKTWRTRDVKAAAVDCMNFVPLRIPVWLLPTTKSSRPRSSN